jgi:hypothetical protein
MSSPRFEALLPGYEAGGPIKQTCRPVSTWLYKIWTALHYPNGGGNRFYRVMTHIISRRQYCRLNWFINGRCTHIWIRKVTTSNLDSDIRRSDDTVRNCWPRTQWDQSSNLNPCTNTSNFQLRPVKVTPPTRQHSWFVISRSTVQIPTLRPKLSWSSSVPQMTGSRPIS